MSSGKDWYYCEHNVRDDRDCDECRKEIDMNAKPLPQGTTEFRTLQDIVDENNKLRGELTAKDKVIDRYERLLEFALLHASSPRVGPLPATTPHPDGVAKAVSW